jgi:hypothetical protein
MNIELKISVKQSDIPPIHLQRIRRVANFMAGDDVEMKITFGDEVSPQEEKPIDPTIDQYPEITKAIWVASRSKKPSVYPHVPKK